MAQYRREKNVGFLGEEDGEGGGRETKSRVQKRFRESKFLNSICSPTPSKEWRSKKDIFYSDGNVTMAPSKSIGTIDFIVDD